MNIGKYVNFICRNKIQSIRTQLWTTKNKTITNNIDDKICTLTWNIVRNTLWGISSSNMYTFVYI